MPTEPRPTQPAPAASSGDAAPDAAPEGAPQPAPAASVIVPSHHGAHRLPRLLAQLEEQHCDRPWEAVVVVDGVVDATPQLLADWAVRLPLRVVTNQTALGVAAALSRGYEAARGDYLIRCDDDLDVGPGFVAGHLAAHDGRTDRVVIAPTRDTFPDTPYAAAYGRPANQRALADITAQPAEHRWINLAACNSFHRTAWAGSGGFDARFAYGEDSEFGYRLHRRGFTFVVAPDLEVGHRGPATSAATRVPRAYVSGASRRLFATVHPEAARPAGRPTGWRGRVWVATVALVAGAVRGRGGYRALGASADRVLPLVPPRLGGRLVALLVEAAGRAGERHGELDLHRYRDQKSAEVAGELRRR